MARDTAARLNRSIGVLIVCPHRLEREGLRLAVEQDEEIEVVGLADRATAARLGRHSAADVAVIGWGWTEPECEGILEHLHAENQVLALLVISRDVRPQHVQSAIRAGARGFLPVDVYVDDLIHAIRTAARDDQVTLHPDLTPAFLSYLASASPSEPTPGSFDSLTPREEEVVRLLARGLADRDLAQTLFISVRTVQTHLSHIYAKLGVHTRTEVALMAVREGRASIPSEGDAEPRSR